VVKVEKNLFAVIDAMGKTHPECHREEWPSPFDSLQRLCSGRRLRTSVTSSVEGTREDQRAASPVELRLLTEPENIPMAAASPSAAPPSAVPPPDGVAQPLDAAALRKIIFAASLGTLFEWYDFYLYGSLAVFFGELFFPPGNDTAHLLASLATFGAGFGVRPLGAIVFGHLGDLIGRKYTFLVTMATMGLGTALIGLLPSYERWGIAATVMLVTLRLVQGLALGGEYGGAATYVAEHVPDDKRGYYTSYIQTTATLGFFLSMGIIGATRLTAGEAAFKQWGWRIPFLLSFVLLAVSLYIRVSMKESPLFSKMKSAGKTSKNPIKESFTNPENLRYVLIALFGATAGQGVVWYTGQFYALTFLQATLKMDWKTAYLLVSISLLLATPLFVYFGRLSDRVGRKKVILAGCLLGAITYLPIYMGMKHFGNPSGLPKANPDEINYVAMVALLTAQMVYVAMVYGPIAAFLVELFPTRIRYTSMSLPYHLGNGWFGGFLPLIATAVTASAWARSTFGAGAIYTGLIYPIAVCIVTLVVGATYIKDTQNNKIDT
jgi:MFS family permease